MLILIWADPTNKRFLEKKRTCAKLQIGFSKTGELALLRVYTYVQAVEHS